MSRDESPVTVPPFNTYLGVHLEAMTGGTAVAILDLGPHHLNNRGVVHGGVLSALLDTAMGAAVVSAIPKEAWCATTSLSVQYLEGARSGRLTCNGQVIRKGRRVAFASGEIHDEGGRLVATAQGSWHLWPHRPEMEARATEAYVAIRGTGERIRVGKIIAVGRNYLEHIKEMGGAGSERPVMFLKPPSAIVHDGGVVRIAEGAGSVHHEVEMVVVIGKDGASIPEAEALDHVLGYAVGLDMTLRDLQNEAKKRGEPWDVAKGFDTSAPVSLVAPRDEVGDVSALELTLDVNGNRRQAGSTSLMIHSVAALVAAASSWFTLEKGDLLFTGTPEGVGPVSEGDLLEARLERVGTLTVRVQRV